MSTDMPRWRHRRLAFWWFALGLALGLIGGALIMSRFPTGANGRAFEKSPADSLSADRGSSDSGAAVPWSMPDVLDLAEKALEKFRAEVGDYTATLIKQEAIGGVLGEEQRLSVKVQCRHRPGDPEGQYPLRVYLHFDRPDNVAGREVIWAEDLHDGKLLAHEAGLLGLLTVALDPTGMIAMRGQKYPISEIGLTNLLEKLVERGREDLDNPEVSVTLTQGAVLEGVTCDLIEVNRAVPTGRPNDFSRAEIWIDPVRLLPIRYTAYGWPEPSSSTAGASAMSAAPLLESYTYLDVRTNVGLTESDFDPANPGYQFR
jgi:hypothetical protein